jgi:SAM-dependent methyltransferase
MVNRNDQQRIADYYDRLVDRYGYDPKACDASGAKSLEVRYRVLSAVTDLTGKSVLEVGCGFGDLGSYLQKKYAGVRYLGIDISRRMVEEGQKAHPNLPIRCQNVLEMHDEDEAFDVVLAQGIFYLLGDNAEFKMRELIKKMFSLSKEAVAFCAISSWAPEQTNSEYCVDPVALLDWCRTLTTQIVLRHEYLPHDVTLYLYRSSNQ